MIILNNVELIGTLVEAPQSLQTRNNKPYVRALIAQAETYQGNDGQEHSKTNYFPVVAFGLKGMDKLMHARRGMTVCIQGTLTSNPYEKRDGSKDYGIGINVLTASLDGDGAPDPLNGDDLPF